MTIDHWDLANISKPAAHLNATPLDGTVVEGLSSRSYWLFAGGRRKLTAASAAAVRVDTPAGGVPGDPVRRPAAAATDPIPGKACAAASGLSPGQGARPPLTSRPHALPVIRQIPRPLTRHPAYYPVAVSLG